ncbi:hypothetical protein HD806DRAFT_521000 [Xylariaceae sp. AK1471]|nr:hypothetical protein HD806DRAFT_521000 [Xylariaceae sp. AK1471]
MFETGDRGRFLPNGPLEFHGRIAGDKHIKLRGFRGLSDIAVVAEKLTAENFSVDLSSLCNLHHLLHLSQIPLAIWRDLCCSSFKAFLAQIDTISWQTTSSRKEVQALLLPGCDPIHRQYNVAPALIDLFKDLTAAAVSSFIDSNGSDASAPGALGMNVNCRYLPRYGTPRIRREDVSAILVAGATSTISTHLLAELLRTKRQAYIYVLGWSEVLTFAAIVEQLELGQTVDCIYFVGGEVSLLQTYSHLKASNFIPIFELVRLSGIGDSLSEIHYLSTWSIAHLQAWPASKCSEGDIVRAEKELTHFLPPPGNDFGYFKARWVAENLLFQAATRGFPVTITRASVMLALDSAQNSTANPGLDEFTTHMVLGMIKTGVVPRIGTPSQPPFAVDIMPIDHAVAALAALTTHTAAQTTDNKA